MKPIIDYDANKLLYPIFKSMAIDSDGNKYMRLSEHMVMDVNTGKIHAISSWPKDK
ncbi:hypothetical protein [uncultured Catenibacterium sp.]|uniref:hypothetical protein n=1 Tax=uncultured Catenibacterium sp. TaxID=286142 RepID=UPI00259163E0|nr:hypothetical protein [uncultured Catenibacterium sp.]